MPTTRRTAAPERTPHAGPEGAATALRLHRPVVPPGPTSGPASGSTSGSASGRSPAAAGRHAAWRSDIDGLRAVAVGAVVLFHLGQSIVPGGFAGVDVFFVISGYLISRNIFGLAVAGRFSTRAFYMARLRRIFPAYAAVLLAVLGIYLWRGLPPDAEMAARTALAAIASVTNVYFLNTTDYFAQPAEALPLLHIWSLSVEEQFYLVFPLVAAWAAARGGRWLAGAVALLLLASLALAAPGAFLYPTATFYLLPARAWELLLGALLVAGVVPPLRARLSRELAAGAGLALIALSFALLSPRTPFPGLAALPPCLGAALILHAGASGDSLGGRLLSLRPLVFLGWISYSLYLWHWPFLALQRTDMPLLDPHHTKLAERGIVLGLSLVAATLSWWLVERPTRDRRRLSDRDLVLGSAAAAALIVGASAALIATSGLPSRFTPAAVAAARYLDNDQRAQFREGRCFLGVSEPFSKFDRAECVPGAAGRPTYVLFGDSHAADLYAGLHAALPEADIAQVTGVQCPPLVVAQPHSGDACPGLIDLASRALPAERKITKVWLSAAWNASRLAPSPGWRADWLGDLKRTVEHFRGLGIEAVVIGPNPEYDLPLPGLIARADQDGRPNRVADALVPDPFALDRTMAAFAAREDIAYVSLIARLCEGDGAGGQGTPERCRAEAAPGVPLLFDRSHFTVEGSKFVAGEIVDALR